MSRELPPTHCRGGHGCSGCNLASPWVPLCRRLCFCSCAAEWTIQTLLLCITRTNLHNPYTLFGLLLKVFRADLAHFWAQLMQCGENFHSPWCWLTFGGSKDCQRKVRNLHYHHPQPFLPHLYLFPLTHLRTVDSLKEICFVFSTQNLCEIAQIFFRCILQLLVILCLRYKYSPISKWKKKCLQWLWSNVETFAPRNCGIS